MIHEVLQSDVEVARRLISSGHPDPEIVVALTSRGIEPAKATQLLDDLHHGRRPAVQVLVVPRPSGDGAVGSPGTARGDAPQEKHSHGSRSRGGKHHPSGIPWWFVILDSAEEPLWSKSDSEKDHLRCIPRQFKSRTDEASA